MRAMPWRPAGSRTASSTAIWPPMRSIIGEMGPVFLDWSDGSITHPFLSAASLLASSGATDDDRSMAYLGPWLTAGIGLTEATGTTALETARPVLPLHVAALYADRVLPSLGPDPDVMGVVPRALRSILSP